ncbi:type III secretion system outer membrane ring subunit SctC [Glaciimonas sp. GG7]
MKVSKKKTAILWLAMFVMIAPALANNVPLTPLRASNTLPASILRDNTLPAPIWGGSSLPAPIRGGNLLSPSVAPWPEEPYSYVGTRTPIRQVLQDFALSFGMQTSIDPSVKGDLNGEVMASNPSKFLDRLSGLYSIDWYVNHGVLTVTQQSQRERKVISVPREALGHMKAVLSSMGVHDARFGWGELPGQSVIAVFGPPAYVDAVANTIGLLTSDSLKQTIGVFKLKYASVQDRVIAYRNKEIVVPGIAQLLQQMAGRVATTQGKEGEADREPIPAPSWGALQNIMVAADVRTNSVIVGASSEMLPMYQKMIEQLDHAAPLIQIEATIIDVDSSDIDQLGVDWSMSVNGVSAGVNNTGESSPMDIAGVLANKATSAMISTVLPGGTNMLARIYALQKEGRAQVVSKPSILGTDNTLAMFDLNETYHILNRGDRAVETLPVTTGLSLRVTPRVVHGIGEKTSRVALQLDIEDGHFSKMDKVENLPVVKRSTISTQAVIGDGESLLIAGHRLNETQTTMSKVPLLGSLPWIGGLFRHTSEKQVNRTRYFLITPTVVPEGVLHQATSDALSVLPAQSKQLNSSPTLLDVSDAGASE